MSARLTNKIENMYDRFTGEFLEQLRSDDFYTYFMNAIKSGEQNVYLYEKYVERNVDLRWVEMIESAIIPLDTIIRNPRRFIKNEEEIVPIEMVKTVTTESIRHLAQHTNMIAMVQGDEVTPQRMLNIVKEESFETYENRFIYTLLQKLQYFLDKRLQALMSNTGSKDVQEFRIDGKCETARDQIQYKLEFSCTTPHVDLAEEDLKINADTSQMSDMQRVERIRRILYDFMGAKLIKDLEGCALVRPPLTMTNVLTKNTDFRKAVDLWMFIERYEDKGYNITSVEHEATPTDNYLNDVFSMIALQYVITKNNSGKIDDEEEDYSVRKQEVLPNIIRRDVNKIIENYDLEIDEVKRIFVKEAEENQKQKNEASKKAADIVQRAMTLERVRLAVDQSNRKSRADRIADREEALKLQAEREAEIKRIRTEFMERETSRIENEIRQKYENIAKERDDKRQKDEEEQAMIRLAERLEREAAEANAREADRLAHEEEEAKVREAERLAHEEEEAKIREAERLAHEEEEAKIREAERLAHEEEEAKIREAERLAHEEEEAKIRETERLAREEEEANERLQKRLVEEQEEAERRIAELYADMVALDGAEDLDYSELLDAEDDEELEFDESSEDDDVTPLIDSLLDGDEE